MSAEVGLKVCLGELRLSLQDLAALKAGSLFELIWHSDQQVLVYLGEKPIAEGRLVSDGQTVFAEVLQLLE